MRTILSDARLEIRAVQDFVAALKAAVPPSPTRQQILDELDEALELKIQEIIDTHRGRAAVASAITAGEISALWIEIQRLTTGCRDESSLKRPKKTRSPKSQ